MQHHRIFAVFAVVLGIGLAWTLIEIGLRLRHYRAFSTPTTKSNVPIMFEPDPELGWQPKPGRYRMPTKDWRGSVGVTIGTDRTRTTDDDAQIGTRPRIAMIGCSFTFGWAVDDTEPFAAVLQRRHPEWAVRNYGVPAYGTVQSLLRLEQLIAQGKKPARVVYGYIYSHPLRNIAHPYWLLLLQDHATQGMVSVPYASLDRNGALVFHPPRAGARWPFREYSATIALVEGQLSMLLARQRIREGQEITDALVRRLATTCAAHDIDLTVAVFDDNAAELQHITNALANTRARALNCGVKLTEDLTVPGDGHPNATAHVKYADCIDAAIGERAASPPNAEPAKPSE